MNTSVNWNSPISAHVPALHAKWKEVEKGLRQIFFSYWFLMLLTAPGLFLLWIALEAPEKWQAFATPPLAILISSLLAGVGTLLWFGLILAGQWHCLRASPQRHAAKELMFVSLFPLIVSPCAIAAGHFFRETNDYRRVLEGLYLLQPATFLEAGTILQLSGLVLLLLNLLLMSGYLRAVGKCLAPSAGTSPVTGLFWFVGFLTGATIGIFLSAGAESLIALGVGWALCLCWHLVLVRAAIRKINRFLCVDPASGRLDNKHKPKPPSGLRYTYRRLETQ